MLKLLFHQYLCKYNFVLSFFTKLILPIFLQCFDNNLMKDPGQSAAPKVPILMNIHGNDLIHSQK